MRKKGDTELVVQLLKSARKIMAKMKGFDARAMADDMERYPEEHWKELTWLIEELKKARKLKP